MQESQPLRYEPPLKPRPARYNRSQATPESKAQGLLDGSGVKDLRPPFPSDTEWTSQEVEVLVSDDGAKWRPLFRGEISETHPAGPNYAFLLKKELSAKREAGQSANSLRIQAASLGTRRN